MEQQSPGLFLRIANILLAAACYLPIVWLVTFYSYVWRVTTKLGHIPRYSGYGTDDITVSQVHEDIIDFVLAAVFFSPFIVLFLLVIIRNMSLSRFRKINLIIYAVS